MEEGRDRIRSMTMLSPAPLPFPLRNSDKPIMRLGELASSSVKMEGKGKAVMKRMGELGVMEGVDVTDVKEDNLEDVHKVVKGRPG